MRRPHQVARTQKTWLMKTIPSAFLGNTDVGTLLLEEAKASRAAEKECPSPVLLSYGEITDATDASRVTGCAAVAMAVGEAGHILRIARVQHHEWRWGEGEGIAMRLGTAESTEEGHWCGQGAPLVQIKFAVHPNSYAAHNRWLLVQTSTSTMIFEPVLHRVPVANRHTSCGFVSNALPYITVDPVLTLSTDQTGGSPHSDVSYDPGSASRSPQLAVIDLAGNWSVWDISGTRRLHGKSLGAVLRKGGTFVDGPSIRLPGDECHRILWLTPSEARSDVSGDSPADASSQARSTGPSGPRFKPFLLLSNRTTVKTLRLQGGEFHYTLSMVRNKKTDVILDVQRCFLDPSQVLVLTTTTLVWLKLAVPGGSQMLPGSEGLRRGGSGDGATVLLSCPHLRGPGDETLRLSIASGPVGMDRNTQLVSIQSARNTPISIFWLTGPDASGLAKFHQQVFRFTAQPTFRTVITIPRALLNTIHDGPRALGAEYAERDVRFFQVIALGTDLGLYSSLCAFASWQEGAITPPSVRRHISRPVNKRAVALRFFGNSFVVSDDFDERTILRVSNPQGQSPTLYKPTDRQRRPTVLDLSQMADLISEKTSMSIIRISARSDVEDLESPFQLVYETVGSGIQNGYLPFGILWVAFIRSWTFTLC